MGSVFSSRRDKNSQEMSPAAQNNSQPKQTANTGSSNTTNSNVQKTDTKKNSVSVLLLGTGETGRF